MVPRLLSVLCSLLLACGFWASEAGAQTKKEPGKPAKMKVAFALLSTIHDLGWTTAHYRGIEVLKREMKDQIVVDYTENVLAADAERVVRNYAKNGYELIFAGVLGSCFVWAPASDIQNPPASSRPHSSDRSRDSMDASSVT